MRSSPRISPQLAAAMVASAALSLPAHKLQEYVSGLAIKSFKKKHYRSGAGCRVYRTVNKFHAGNITEAQANARRLRQIQFGMLKIS